MVFLDDDCRPEKGWLAAYEEAAAAATAANNAEVLEGRTECPMEDGFAFYEIVENRTGGAFWTCNLAVRRESFVELGGFDEDFTSACAEDMEFAWRMRARGLRSVFVEQAAVTHPPRRMTFAALVKRTAAHRWILLYRLKTGQGPGLDCSPPQAAAALVLRESVDKLRTICHLRRDRRRIKARTVDVLWRCLTLIGFLPYYIYWELKYRRAQKPPP
jgi:GT2 family glycosyltransferase